MVEGYYSTLSSRVSVSPCKCCDEAPLYHSLTASVLTLKVLNLWKFTYKWSWWIFDRYCCLKLIVGHGVSSAGSYLADPTSPIPSHCASVVATSTVRVNTGAFTLPRQWSLITISQDNHSFHPTFPTDHCRLVSIFRRKVRWRSEHVYARITDTCRLT